MKKSMRVILGDLRGPDGNAYAILGNCRDAINLYVREGAITKEQGNAFWEEFHAEATSSDYEHLLATVDAYFMVKSKVGELHETTAQQLAGYEAP